MHMLRILVCLVGLHLPLCAAEYFQQEVNYTIEVELDDINHMLHGHVTMTYTNNAPHALNEIFILAMPNAYQKGTALYKQMSEGLMPTVRLFDKQENLGFCDSLHFEIDGEFHAYSIYENNPDVLRIALKKPILPGEKRVITTPFRVKIPNARISRLGHLGQDYMITQWYPKAAAYDRDGWHPYPYLAKGEYYAPFGSFSVSIILPENYYVGATGVLQNEDEWERLHKRATASDSLVGKRVETPLSDSTTKTLVYTQEHIHDFAFFASKTFLVEIQRFDLDEREITAMAFYQPHNKSKWQTKGLEYIIRATRFYSEEVGPYPYDYVSAVDGTIAAGGGMEYPMITVIGNASGVLLDRVIAHEVGHNWFYGILATNERLFPYLDEGMNSHIEKKYIETYYPDEGVLGKVKAFGFRQWEAADQHFLTYRYVGSWNADQPMNLPAEQYSDVNYGAVVYAKSAVAWDHLRGYMGEEAFTNAMRHYYNTWKFRHPGPDDVRKSFEESAGKKLDWFFNDMVKTTKKVDYSVVSYKYKDGKTHVKVKNKGNIAAPVALTFSTDTTSSKTRKTSVSLEGDTTVWEEGFTGTKTFVYDVDMGNVATHNALNNALDITLHNDISSERGAGGKKIKLHILPLLENREERQHAILPWIGGNAGDGFMTGLVFHNRSFFGKDFEYYVAPAYGFRSGDIAGLAGFEYKIFTPKSAWLQYISLGVESSRFHKNIETGTTLDNTEVQLASLYNRLNPSAVFHFKKQNQSKSFNHSAGIQMRWINTESETIDFFTSDQIIDLQKKYTAHEIFYQFRKKNLNRSHSGYISFENIAEQQNHWGIMGGVNLPVTGANKLSGTYEFAKRYWKKKSIETRLFAGYMSAPSPYENPYHYRLSSWSGAQDYRYDDLYFDRSGATGQFMRREGGFLVHSDIQAYTTMSSLWLKIDIPYLPFSLYGEGALMDREQGTSAGTQVTWNTYYSSGIIWDVIPGILSVGLPLVHDTALEQHVSALQPKFFQRARFSLNLRNVNPYTLIKKLL